MNAEVMEKIFAYIDEHICERISLAEVAALVGYSPILESRRASGMELVFKPDSAIFGKLDFSRERIREWVMENGVEDFVKKIQ